MSGWTTCISIEGHEDRHQNGQGAWVALGFESGIEHAWGPTAQPIRITAEKITAGAITAEKIGGGRPVLSPADQHLIATLENKHVTLAEFQRMHGLEADGIMGPRTQALIKDLEYKRRNNAEIELLSQQAGRIVRMPEFAHPAPRRAEGGYVVPVSVIEKRYPALREVNSFGTVIYDAHKPVKKMTREEYRKRFSEMEYIVTRNEHLGFQVLVSLARGGKWEYWRPTRPCAERTGAKRLKRELSRLDDIFDADNPQGVRARDLGIHYQMTSDELTEELAKQEQADQAKAQAEWDAEFKASTTGKISGE